MWFLFLPSDLQPFFVVRTEELEGLVDLHTLSPVLPYVELCVKEGKAAWIKFLGAKKKNVPFARLILSQAAPLVGTPIQFR